PAARPPLPPPPRPSPGSRRRAWRTRYGYAGGRKSQAVDDLVDELQPCDSSPLPWPPLLRSRNHADGGFETEGGQRYVPGGGWSGSPRPGIAPGGRPRWRICSSWDWTAICWVNRVAWMPWNRPSSQPTSWAWATRSSASEGVALSKGDVRR